MISILAVGVTLLVGLGSLVLILQARTDKRLAALGTELQGLRSDVRALGVRVAWIEGVIKGAGLFGRARALKRAAD